MFFDYAARDFAVAVEAVRGLDPSHPELADIFRKEAIDELIAWI